MIRLTVAAQQYMKSLRDIQVKLIIPSTVTENFVIGYLVSSEGLTLASLDWVAADKQVVMISTAPLEDNVGNSFTYVGLTYTNTQLKYITRPYNGTDLYARNGVMVPFSNTLYTIDTSLNIMNNNATFVLNNCTVTDSSSNNIVSFDMCLTYVGNISTGKNILLLKSDSFGLEEKPDEPIRPGVAKPSKAKKEIKSSVV